MTISPSCCTGQSWVQIDLDTTPPVLVLEAERRVSPPDPWVVLVRGNEDFDLAVAVFTDALGVEHRLGVERVSARLFTVVLPTVGMASGPGELRVVARDGACNAATATTTVVLDRPRAFDVSLEFSRGFDTVVLFDHAYEVEVGVSTGFDTYLEITRGPEQQ